MPTTIAGWVEHAHIHGRPPCASCGKTATCAGVYEDPSADAAPACDECCGHGCEDGVCERLPGSPGYEGGDE